MYDIAVDIRRVGEAAGTSNSIELANYLQEKAEALSMAYLMKTSGTVTLGLAKIFPALWKGTEKWGRSSLYDDWGRHHGRLS